MIKSIHTTHCKYAQKGNTVHVMKHKISNARGIPLQRDTIESSNFAAHDSYTQNMTLLLLLVNLP